MVTGYPPDQGLANLAAAPRRRFCTVLQTSTHPPVPCLGNRPAGMIHDMQHAPVLGRGGLRGGVQEQRAREHGLAPPIPVYGSLSATGGNPPGEPRTTTEARRGRLARRRKITPPHHALPPPAARVSGHRNLFCLRVPVTGISGLAGCGCGAFFTTERQCWFARVGCSTIDFIGGPSTIS